MAFLAIGIVAILLIAGGAWPLAAILLLVTVWVTLQ